MTTTTEVAKSTGGALAIRSDQTEWTDAQVAVLRQAGVSEEVAPAELSGFLHLCQRTQLDPFSRQIYLIGRWDNRVKRKVFTPQTAIDGYRVVAHRAAAEAHESFGYEDTQWCDAAGRWRDVWLSNEPPAAARVTVLRRGERFSAVALFREYVQTNGDGRPTGLWGRMPAGQVAKCAETLALRKAFPHDLAGVYTAEEMAQAENPAAVAEPQPAAAPASSDPEAQAIADRAAKATEPEQIKGAWGAARDTGLLNALQHSPDTGRLEMLREYLGRRGKALSEAAAPAAEDIPDAEMVENEPEPEASAAPTGEPATAPQMRLLHVLMGQLGLTERAEALEYVAGVIGRQVPSRNELTKTEMQLLLDHMQAAVNAIPVAS